MNLPMPFARLAPVALLLVAAAVSPLRAEPPPQKIDTKAFQTSVNDVVVPIPSEVFNVLDKLGHPNWASQVRTDLNAHPTARPHVSLLFGTVIADGFLAVQAKDADKVKKIGRRVLDLATALSVRENVISHTQSITEAADASDWGRVKSELDKTQKEVKGAMEKLSDGDASELVSMGGWLRGTEAVTDLIAKDYNPDRAELLHQVDLLNTFEKQLAGMKAKTRTNPLVNKLQTGLTEIRPLVADQNADIKRESVQKIYGITNNLVSMIYAQTPPTP